MDIDELPVGRLLNVAYSTIITDAGALADRSEVRKHIDGVLARAGAGPKSNRGPVRRGGMTPAQAAKIQADLLDYDSKAAKGQVGG